MEYIAIGLLVLMSAVFSSMETAFSSCNKIRLKHKASEGNRKAEKALKIANNFDKALTTILIGNNIVNIFSASLGTVVFTNIFKASGNEALAVPVSTFVMTVLVLIFGEILPKSLAKQNPEKFATVYAPILSGIMFILTPLSAFFMMIQRAATKMFKTGENAPSVTEDELKYMIGEIEDEGVLEEKESELVRSALEFDEINVEEIIVPRVKVVAIEITDSIEKIMEIFIKERYSRLPVYENTIDNIIGVINEKDFLFLYTQNKSATSIESIVQKTLYVSEMKLISEILYEMQRSKMHMAIVKDQYGGTSGIVTMEDIIEELVGEIYDENDEVVNAVLPLGDNIYEVMTEYSLNDLLEELDIPSNIVNSDSNTVAGWVMELFGRIPETGDEVSSGIFEITVVEANEQCVNKIALKIVD